MALPALEEMDFITHNREYFDTIYPWAGMRRVAVAPNKEIMGIHHPDDTNKWEDGSSVNWSTYESNGWNCMVQIPKFWYKAELGLINEKKTFRWFVSDEPKKGFKVHPAFVRDGVEQDYQYLSAFEGSLIGGKLRSLPNKSVQVNRTRGQFRTDAQANGSGWEQQDFLITCAVQLLYLLEYGHFDSQTKIGEGRVNQSAYANTGLSLSNGNKTFGNNLYMTYRGIENFWGNYYKWVDGINVNNYVAFIADSNFADDKFTDNYKSVGFTNWASNGYGGDIGFAENCDFAFLPIAGGGSSSSKLYDYYYQNSGTRVAWFGGHRSARSLAGAFCWDLNHSSAYSSSYVGGRLSLIR